MLTEHILVNSNCIRIKGAVSREFNLFKLTLAQPPPPVVFVLTFPSRFLCCIVRGFICAFVFSLIVPHFTLFWYFVIFSMSTKYHLLSITKTDLFK